MAEGDPTPGSLWYVRRGSRERGPFTAAQISKYVLLGRVRTSDEISLDRAAWKPVQEEPAVLPPAMRGDAPPEALERLRIREDERRGIDRRRGPDAEPAPEGERRNESERRAPEPEQIIRHQQRKARFLQQLRQRRDTSRDAWIGLGVALVVIVGLALLLGAPEEESTPDCQAPPGPNVNWSNCRLESLEAPRAELPGALLRNARLRDANLQAAHLAGADLAYAELAKADLSYADLGGAVLKGAMLQGADLTYANLAGADLSYADLRDARIGGAELEGAVLGDAIWLDGRVCPRGAVGVCAPPP